MNYVEKFCDGNYNLGGILIKKIRTNYKQTNYNINFKMNTDINR